MGKKPPSPELRIEEMLNLYSKQKKRSAKLLEDLLLNLPEYIDDELDSALEHEDILIEGILFTNAIVDAIHGKIPEKTETNRTAYFHQLLRAIISKGETLLENLIPFSIHSPKHSEYWNQICQMRRVTQRIVVALNGFHHRDAIEKKSTKVSIVDIQRLCNLNARINNKILNKTHSIRTMKSAHWHDFAVAYEGSILLRAKGNVAAAIELSNYCMKMGLYGKEEILEESITGLIAFNQKLFNDFELIEGEFLKPHEFLFKLSNQISRNSKNAARQGLNLQKEDSMLLLGALNRIVSYAEQREKEFTTSSILHLEGLIRVFSYQIRWTTLRGETPKLFQEELVNTCNYIYRDILPKLVKSTKSSNWIKDAMLAKIEQDSKGLFSEITPSVFIDPEYLDESDFREIDHEKNLANVNAWENWRDSPSQVRQRFRLAVIDDITTRLEDSDFDFPELGHLTVLLGEPREANALTKRGLAGWFAGDPARPSLHLQHFPQGHINQAQIAIAMAQMQYLLRGNKGVFGNLEKIIRLDRRQDSPWIINKKKGKPQFTIGYFGNFTPTKEKPNPSRGNLSRVNRLDEMMYVAKALNSVFEIVNSELDNPIKKFDRILRDCKIDDRINLISGKYLHLHELFYYAEEASQSPMRIDESLPSSGNDDDSAISTITERIFRASFVRLYCLSLRAEHLARIIIQRPLREPFLSSCILLIEQARSLLDLIHTDWQESSKSFSFSQSKTNSNDFKIKKFDELCKLVNSKRQNYFDKIESPDCLNMKNHDEVKPDVAIEYLIAHGIEKFADIENLVDYSKYRLRFARLDNWNDLLQESLHLRYDRDASAGELKTSSDIFAIAPNENSSQSKIPANQKSVVEIFEKLQHRVNQREWVIWARLLWYPTAFVGRVLVSANTPRDLNQDKQKSARSLVFGKLEEIFYSDSTYDNDVYGNLTKLDRSIVHFRGRSHHLIPDLIQE